MSAGYASRLSEYHNKGVCGLPERHDTNMRSLGLKLKRLHELVKESRHLVVLTGAGISTSAGVPDFRGPKGIWTMEEKHKKKENETNDTTSAGRGLKVIGSSVVGSLNGMQDRIVSGSKKRPREETIDPNTTTSKSSRPQPEQNNHVGDFMSAKPTYTHLALSKLAQDGILKYCITQNVDGLHSRSGLSRSKHSVLHGCAFTEVCEDCNLHYFRDFDVGGMSFQKTGRKCNGGCQQGDLRDTLLDWEDALPEYDYSRAQEECDKSDLVICLGTSLRIEPAGGLPMKAQKFVIVNLQETPYDGHASLIIRARVDDVLEDLMNKLGYPPGWVVSYREEIAVEEMWRPPPLQST